LIRANEPPAFADHFRGFLEDCLIQGRLRLPRDTRLTDFLNDTDTLRLADTKLFALEDGRRVDAGDQVLSMDDILAVQPRGGAGSSERYVRTRVAVVELELGPYSIRGSLHGVMTADPVAMLTRRKSMIPLTDVTIRYVYAGRPIQRGMSVLIINRLHAQGVHRVGTEKSKIDEILPPVDPLAKDLTGRVRGDEQVVNREGLEPSTS
jgi:hypothetical protein